MVVYPILQYYKQESFTYSENNCHTLHVERK